jgi:hypothetical protein
VQHDEAREFNGSVGRDDFLQAARNYLKNLNHEELLVAVGSRRGNARNSGAALRRVHRTIGDRSHVAVTAKLRTLLNVELQREGAEIILIHNHPPNPLKMAIRRAIGWRPLPSDADRALAFNLFERRAQHFMTAQRPSSLKWFLVDEGRIGEFFLPPSDLVGRLLDSLPKV